ncbi:Hypothetical protein, putative [Bodo saltans]|uniref:Uncharacterized protein n=1 Tax=Bodo saltans TaxID=75058 RepID=A0A0S4IWC2_BODSA|nr:Hypothetical protein, putative [Bodo saltans]|eukprot:CUG27759.1 Hypothetical protein, putative [Bodo saltans]
MSQEGGHNSTTSTLRQGQSHRASHVSQDPLDFNNASPRAHTAGAVERSNPFYDGRVVPSQPGWPSQHSNRSEERPLSTARFDLSVSQHNSAIQAPQTLRPKRVVDFQAFDDTELPSAAPLPTTTFVPAATMGMGRPPQFAIPSPPSMMVPSLQPTEVLLSKTYHNTHLTLSQPPSTEEAAYTLQQQHKDQIQLRPGESIFTMLALRGLLAPNHPHFPFNIPTTLPAAAQAILDRHRPDLQHLDTKPLYRRLRLKDDDDVEQKWNGSLPGPAMLRQSDRPTPVLLDDAEQDRRLQESQLRGVTSSGGDASAAVAQGTTSRFAELAKQLQRDIPKINGQSIIELSRSHAHSLLFPPPRVLEARQRHQDTLTTSDRVISFQNIPPPAVSYIQPAAVVQHRSAFSASAEQLIRVDPLGRPPTTNSSLLPEPRLLPQQDHSHGYALPASTNLVSHAHPFAPQLPSSSATPIATTTIHPQALSASHYVPLEVVAAPPSQPPPPPIHGGVFMPSSSHCGLPRTYVNSSLETPPPLPATSALVIPAAAPSSPIPTTVPLTTTTTGINEETYTLTKSELLEYCRTFVQQIIQQQHFFFFSSRTLRSFDCQKAIILWHQLVHPRRNSLTWVSTSRR